MSQEKLWQKRTAPGQLFWSPRAGERVEETPPVFSFIQEKGPGTYRVQVRRATGEMVFDQLTQRCFIRPSKALDAGQYSWRLSCGEAATDWIPFEIAETAVTFLAPSIEAVWDAIPSCRPMHLFFAEDR